MILHPFDAIADRRVDIGSRLATDVRLDEAIALRRCAMYRKAFRGTAIGYPAAAIRLDAIAGWMRREGVTVDAASADELDWAVIAGIHPSHIVMHGLDEAAGLIALGVGRVIVESAEQMAMLRSCATGPQAVLVDVTDACLERPLMVDRRVQFHGLHYRADGADITGLAEIISAMIAEMAGITRKWGGVLSRLSVGGVDLTDGDADSRILRRVAPTINEVVEEACIRFRYPRPALTVSPSPITLLPAV
jgi:Pyridoxal-dependent decarboxylase, pyridoxal binding domain